MINGVFRVDPASAPSSAPARARGDPRFVIAAPRAAGTEAELGPRAQEGDDVRPFSRLDDSRNPQHNAAGAPPRRGQGATRFPANGDPGPPPLYLTPAGQTWEPSTQLRDLVDQATAVGKAAANRDADSVESASGPSTARYRITVSEHIINTVTAPVATGRADGEVSGRGAMQIKGMTASGTGDDNAARVGDAGRRPGLPNAFSISVDDWEPLAIAVRQGGVGTVAEVTTGQPGNGTSLQRQRVILIHTANDGVVLIDPKTPSDPTTVIALDPGTTPSDPLDPRGDTLPRLINARAVVRDRDGRLITHTVPVTPEPNSAPRFPALTDPLTDAGRRPQPDAQRAGPGSAQAESPHVAAPTGRPPWARASAHEVTAGAPGAGARPSRPAMPPADLNADPRGADAVDPPGPRAGQPAHRVSSRYTPPAPPHRQAGSSDAALEGLADFNALVRRQEESAAASGPVRDFGTRQNGALNLAYIAPVPQRTVEWLRQQVFRMVEGDREPDARFHADVERALTSRLLTAEWARLFSTSGLPLRVKYKGQWYPVSLRLSTALVGKADPRMPSMPDGGPPVTVQRWAFGIGETDDTAAKTGQRPGSVAYTHYFDTDAGKLRQVAVSPQLNLVYNQANSVVTTGSTIQPMVIMRSRERTFPYEYEMAWELRPGDATSEIFSGRVPDNGWQAVEQAAPDKLVVWFPRHLAEAARTLPAPDPDDPATVPAPVERLLDEVPLYGVVDMPGHDRLFADVMASFPGHLSQLSDWSREELREFFSEGNMRGNLPAAWGGSVPSPTLYAKSGAVIGYLKVSIDLDGGQQITGPTTQNAVVETYVLRSLKMQGSSAVTNTLGVNLPIPALSFSLGGAKDPETGVRGFGGALTFQAGGSHTFAHTLSSGGSARLARSLRTATPLFQVEPQAAVRVTLVRPAGAQVHPVAGTPLADAGRRYPVAMKVPSLATLGHAPAEPRYLPAHLVHLRSLGVSTTPLQVSGVEPLFDQAERWLGEHGFLPSQSAVAGALDLATQKSVRASRLNNMRKLDQARSRLGLRAELEEMIQGGASVTFEVPTTSGVRRAAINLTAERRYTGQDADHGVEHYWTLPNVQTLNYTGSTFSGDEQFSSTPFAWNASVTGSVTNPLNRTQNTQGLNQITGAYTYNRQKTRVSGASSGTGHEYYQLSPTQDGIQLFGVPVTYRMEFSFSHGQAPEPAQAEGAVRLAVPTYRAPTEPAAPAAPPVTVRDQTDEDVVRLTLPGSGHTYHNGVLRLPETAVLERVEGSRALKETVRDILDGLERETAELERAAQQAEPPLMPGAWPHDDTPNEGEHVPAGQAGPGRPRLGPILPMQHVPADTPEAPAPGTAAFTWAGALTKAAVSMAKAAAGETVRRTGAAGAWRFVRQVAVGEPAADEGSATERVYQNALSPQHLAGNALRVFRDSYVIEGGGTAGAVAGTDVTVEVTGYITDVRLLPQPPKMDSERWLQSTSFSMTTDSLTAGHNIAGSMTGQYGTVSRSFDPVGTYQFTTSTTDSSMVNDNTGAFRVTTEDTTFVHRFTAKAVFVVTVRRGVSNVLVGTLRPGPGLERTRVVEVPDGLEFLLVDNDLRNHPELPATGPPLPEDSRRDRMLPSWYIDGDGAMGAGVVTEVHLEGGRGAFHNAVVAAVEKQAPGVTQPGHATYLRNVLTRINEHTSTLGMRTLPNAGPNGHTAFHFIHRSWLGPHLVEVAFTARPTPDADLAEIRGRLADPTSGVDNVFGHSSGDGAALKVPGATGVSTTWTTSHELDFAPLGQVRGNQGRPNLRLSGSRTTTDSQTSARELRAWKRTANSVEFNKVPYVYEWTVSSRPLDEALLVRLVRAGLAGLTSGLVWTGRATNLLGLLRAAPQHHSRLATHATGRQPASVSLRFDADEAPDYEGHRAISVGPRMYAFDPTIAPGAVPDGHVLQIGPDELPADARGLLSGAQWVPSRPFQVYDFGGIQELRQALQEVDPSLEQDVVLWTSQSAEGMFLRLNRLIASNRLTVLEPAATSSFLGHPGGKGTSIKVTLYSPRPETTSRDVAIDRVELSTDGSISQMDKSTVTSLRFGGSPLDGGGANRGGPSVPLLGGAENAGQISSFSSQRRELLRIGTPREGADGSGLTGHRVRAVAVLEVQGPSGTRWVIGDLLFRTTETPPAVAEEVADAEGTIPVTNGAEASPPSMARPTARQPLATREGDPRGGGHGAIEWRESTHSLPQGPDGVKACVSIAVVGLAPSSGAVRLQPAPPRGLDSGLEPRLRAEPTA